ncbi:hypothetical protein SAMN05428981_1011300 [Bacillus sp. OV194]|nr:hypothetical protein SAMN05428981_1011300 [Bacillus sp. OV194]
MAKVEIGEAQVSVGVAEYVDDNGIDRQRVADMLVRHENGDWGELSEEQKRANDIAAATGKSFMSNYKLDDKYILILTETENDEPETLILTLEEFIEDYVEEE